MIASRIGALAVTMSLVCLAGCGKSGPSRIAVTGTVMYQGKPVPAGRVLFDPDARKGNDGPQGYAHVKDGKFDTRDQGNGPVAGPQIVRIDGFDGIPAREMPQGKSIFPEWQTAIDLDPAKTEFDFVVPPGGGSKKP